MKRLEHLKNIRGIGLFTGLPGVGKTYTMRAFIASLNPNLYKVVYLPMTTITTNEFYKDLASGLGLTPSYRKIDNFRQIQERIKALYKDQKITLAILIDEAQYLSRAILADLKLLMNFDMDSRMKLCGVSQPVFEEGAMEAAYGSCQGSIRKLNSLIHQALMIGCEIKSAQITTDIIMDAASEIKLL